VIAEDWRWRMVTPSKEIASILITPESRKLVDAWDPAKDEAAARLQGVWRGGTDASAGRATSPGRTTRR
jgi:hypothetical protein